MDVHKKLRAEYFYSRAVSRVHMLVVYLCTAFVASIVLQFTILFYVTSYNQYYLVPILHDVKATGSYIAQQVNEDRSNIKEVMQEWAHIEITEEEEQQFAQVDDEGLGMH